MSSYAVMVCIDEAEDDWLFLTQPAQDSWDVQPILFEDAESALAYATPWIKEGKEHNVVVVSYEG